MRNIYDGIIGLATGDALGVPVEFMSRECIARNPVKSMREYGTHHQPIGVWSDDTSLTLALLNFRQRIYKRIMLKHTCIITLKAL